MIKSTYLKIINLYRKCIGKKMCSKCRTNPAKSSKKLLSSLPTKEEGGLFWAPTPSETFKDKWYLNFISFLHRYLPYIIWGLKFCKGSKYTYLFLFIIYQIRPSTNKENLYNWPLPELCLPIVHYPSVWCSMACICRTYLKHWNTL